MGLLPINYSGRRMPDKRQLTEFFPDTKYFENGYLNYLWKGSFHYKGQDIWPDFYWIRELENKVQNELNKKNYLSKMTILEIFKWGTSSRHKMKKRAEELSMTDFWERRTKITYSIIKQIPADQTQQNIIDWISDVYISLATEEKDGAIGFTYFSKILRFMSPDYFGARDEDRIVPFFSKGWTDCYKNTFKLGLRTRQDRTDEAKAYGRFCWVLQNLACHLNNKGSRIPINNRDEKKVWRGNMHWRASDIEMAFFGIASDNKCC